MKRVEGQSLEFIKENQKVKKKENTLSIEKRDQEKKKEKTITVKKKERKHARDQESKIQQKNDNDIFNLVESTNDRNYYKWLKVKLIDIFEFLIVFLVAFLVESVFSFSFLTFLVFL